MNWCEWPVCTGLMDDRGTLDGAGGSEVHSYLIPNFCLKELLTSFQIWMYLFLKCVYIYAIFRQKL